MPIIGPDSDDVLVEGQTFAYELSAIDENLTGVRTEDPDRRAQGRYGTADEFPAVQLSRKITFFLKTAASGSGCFFAQEKDRKNVSFLPDFICYNSKKGA